MVFLGKQICALGSSFGDFRLLVSLEKLFYIKMQFKQKKGLTTAPEDFVFSHKAN